MKSLLLAAALSMLAIEVTRGGGCISVVSVIESVVHHPKYASHRVLSTEQERAASNALVHSVRGDPDEYYELLILVIRNDGFGLLFVGHGTAICGSVGWRCWKERKISQQPCSLDRFPSAYLAVRTAAFRKIISTRFGFRLSSFDRRASGCVLKTGSRRREKADFGAENTSASLPRRLRLDSRTHRSAGL